MRAALIATLLAVPSVTLTVHADESPLIAYAQELSASPSPSGIKAADIAQANLRAVNFEMSHHPPPRDPDCAQTLGAQRFAGQYTHLAAIQDELGNFEAVIAAYKSALACEPRVATDAAFIASAYLSLGQVGEARVAAERASAMDPDNADARNARARVDFLQERWADAIARFRLETLEREKNDGRYDEYAYYYATYSRCYLWLAQRRAGVRNPEVPPRPDKKLHAGEPEIDPKHWPLPVLETLRGERSEAALAQAIREDGAIEARQWLTEALFYVGELKLAEGDLESARRHFATVINLRVLNYVEYGMARSELERMRERKTVAAATAGIEAPAR